MTSPALPTADFAATTRTSSDRGLRVFGLALILVLAYVFSEWLLGIYTQSDQEFYAKFYYALMYSDSAYWADLQRVHLGSAEPLYRLVIGVAAHQQLDRIAYLSMWNAVLVGAVCLALARYKASLPFWILALTTNYLFVLIGPAERLKFAYIMLALAFIAKDTRMKGVLGATSIFFHTQAIAQILASAAGYVFDNYRTIFRSRTRIVLTLLAGVPASIAVGFLFVRSVGDVAVSKADKYASESTGTFEAFQWILILICGLLAFEKRAKFLIGMIPIGMLTVMYGGRINVATFTLFCATALTEGKTRNPVVLLVMTYMSIKSIGFIQNTLIYGQAF